MKKLLIVLTTVMLVFIGMNHAQLKYGRIEGKVIDEESVPLPGVDQPVGWSAAAFFNPSFPYLFSHRFFANISYTMLLTGGVFAIKHIRQKDPEEKLYFGWAADFTFAIGFLTFFAI